MGSIWKRSGLLYIVILFAGIAVVTMFFSTPVKPEEVPLSRVIAMSQTGEINGIVEQGEWLTSTTTGGKELKTNRGNLGYNELRELGLNPDIKYEIKSGGINWGNLLIGFLPLL